MSFPGDRIEIKAGQIASLFDELNTRTGIDIPIGVFKAHSWFSGFYTGVNQPLLFRTCGKCGDSFISLVDRSLLEQFKAEMAWGRCCDTRDSLLLAWRDNASR